MINNLTSDSESDRKFKAFKLKTGTFFNKKCKLGKGTIIVVDETDSGFVKIQGKSGRTAVKLVDYSDILEEVNIDERYYNSLIEMPDSLKEKKILLNNIGKKFPEFEKQIITLSTWIFQSKGSNDVTYKQWTEWKDNPESLISESVKKGFNAKPGSHVFNRSQRNNIIADEDSWMKDLNEVLPNGIGQEDFADFIEQEKILDKLISEFLSLGDIPSEMIDYCIKIGLVSNITPNSHRDYVTQNSLSVLLFEANEHHSKEKGLELCHKNPKIGTKAYNVTIGSSKSNREQGGSSLEKRICDGFRSFIFKHSSNLSFTEIQKINDFVDSDNETELLNIVKTINIIT